MRSTKDTSDKIFEDRGLRAVEAAEVLGIAKSTLWRWTRQGLLKNAKIGGKVTIWKMSELQRFLREGDNA